VTSEGVCHQIKTNLKLNCHQCEAPQQTIWEFVEGGLIIDEKDVISPAAATQICATHHPLHTTRQSPPRSTTSPTTFQTEPTNNRYQTCSCQSSTPNPRKTSITLHIPPLSPPQRHRHLTTSSHHHRHCKPTTDPPSREPPPPPPHLIPPNGSCNGSTTTPNLTKPHHHHRNHLLTTTKPPPLNSTTSAPPTHTTILCLPVLGVTNFTFISSDVFIIHDIGSPPSNCKC